MSPTLVASHPPPRRRSSPAPGCARRADRPRGAGLREAGLALGVIAGMVAGCAVSPPAPASEDDLDDDLRGIEGANCAEFERNLPAADQIKYPFPSVVAYFYQVLSAAQTKLGTTAVIQTWLPRTLDATQAWLRGWQAKSVQILASPQQPGFANGNFYRGMLGLAGPPQGKGACQDVLNPTVRANGSLAHVALSQARRCTADLAGNQGFWNVDGIVLVRLGDTLDATALVNANVAEDVHGATSSRCLVPAKGNRGGDGAVPCKIALRADAAIEGVVVPVPTDQVVAGVALGYRPFTAAGTDPMPSVLAPIRTVVRSRLLGAMHAIGSVQTEVPPRSAPNTIKLTGVRVGPMRTPTAALSAAERAWVDGLVRPYDAGCCTQTCTPASPGHAATCVTSCVPEGTCATATLTAANTQNQGLIVLVGSSTIATCSAVCPAPATGITLSAPTCTP